MMRMVHRQHGFTIIELMTVVAVAAILVTLAAPSFRGYLAKKKVEGVLAELVTDVQYARSEAVARNANVRMSFGSNCYVIHTPATSTADAACLVTSGSAVRAVRVEDANAVSVAALGSLSDVVFDSVRGNATLNGVVTNEGNVEVRSATGISPPVVFRAVVSTQGRVRTCTTNGVAGYTSC